MPRGLEGLPDHRSRSRVGRRRASVNRRPATSERTAFHPPVGRVPFSLRIAACGSDMPVRNLREFLDLLRREGDLVEVAPRRSLPPIAEVHRRVSPPAVPPCSSPAREGHFPSSRIFRHGEAHRARVRPRPSDSSRAVDCRALMPPTLGKLCAFEARLKRSARLRRVGAGPLPRLSTFPPPSPPARAHDLAGGRRTVHHSPRLHDTPNGAHNLVYRIHIYDGRRRAPWRS